ncbi:MAG: NAD(P)-binding protein [Oscillospiraceae bacterium]
MAIIGGGPGGLTAAYYLALMGHKVTVYEHAAKLGGMLRYGIPSYRFPGRCWTREIDSILSLGIEVHTNVSHRPGYLAMEELEKQFDCIYIAIGAHNDKKPGIEGEDSQERDRPPWRCSRPSATTRCPTSPASRWWSSAAATWPWTSPAAPSAWAQQRSPVSTAAAGGGHDRPARGGGRRPWPRAPRCCLCRLPARIEADEDGAVTALWTQPQIIGRYGQGRPSRHRSAAHETGVPHPLRTM